MIYGRVAFKFKLSERGIGRTEASIHCGIYCHNSYFTIETQILKRNGSEFKSFNLIIMIKV